MVHPVFWPEPDREGVIEEGRPSCDIDRLSQVASILMVRGWNFSAELFHYFLGTYQSYEQAENSKIIAELYTQLTVTVTS